MKTHEMALFSAIATDVVLDLRDRGIISSTTACDVCNYIQRLADMQKERFFTEELPDIGKALDAYLQTDESTPRTLHQEVLEHLWCKIVPIFGTEVAYSLLEEEVLPRLISAIRDLSYLFYKYEAPLDATKTKLAIANFIAIEEGLDTTVDHYPADRAFFARLFRGCDLGDIKPRHGPGAVSGKETGPLKYDWSALPERLVNVFSYDYFVASPQHLSEELGRFMGSDSSEPMARLLTVPKDSRGPRVISCEPKEFQWIQQGIMDRMVEWVERHPLTRGHVRFTDQSVNGELALKASRDQTYATLDLKEASDRVSLAYVMLHFPVEVSLYLCACRSLATVLPDGRVFPLRKFAPMGSANCFPVLALVVYARLYTAGIRDSHVFGDDVIVPTAKADEAIAALEVIGLKVNRSKSCTSGFFRESCGVDAYKGVNVTPTRIKRVWRTSRHPDTYVSWISYANSMYRKGYVRAAERIARLLVQIYGPIMQVEDEDVNVPAFNFSVPDLPRPRVRTNRELQVLEYRVLVPEPRKVRYHRKDSYKLLHWFTQTWSDKELSPLDFIFARKQTKRLVSLYTRRGTTKLHYKWSQVYPVVDAMVKG